MAKSSATNVRKGLPESFANELDIRPYLCVSKVLLFIYRISVPLLCHKLYGAGAASESHVTSDTGVNGLGVAHGLINCVGMECASEVNISELPEVEMV